MPRPLARASMGALLGVLVSCAKPSNDAASMAASSSAPPPSTSASSAKPPLIETTPTPTDRIGTLAPNTGIPVGQKIPDGHARDLDGKDVTLSVVGRLKARKFGRGAGHVFFGLVDLGVVAFGEVSRVRSSA